MKYILIIVVCIAIVPNLKSQVEISEDNIHNLDHYETSIDDEKGEPLLTDRKSTRLHSSHTVNIVCRLLLEKKKKED